jgi:hypothetical protein
MSGSPGRLLVSSASTAAGHRRRRLSAAATPANLRVRRRAGVAAYGMRHRRGRHVSVQQYDEIGEAFEGFKSLPLMRYEGCRASSGWSGT